MAGNFLQQENVVLTGACEAIVVDVQCIFPALGPLSKCFHTKFITTSKIAQMPDSEFIHFTVESAAEKAKAIVKMAIENFQNRKPELVHIPDMKQKATVGYSLEAIKKVLDGVTNSQVDELGTCLLYTSPAGQQADISLYVYRDGVEEYHSMTAASAVADALVLAVSEQLKEASARSLVRVQKLKEAYRKKEI